MLPILLVLGATGALLEIKRLVNRPPQSGDAIRFKESEERLRRVLQEVQQELHKARSEQQRDQARAEELKRTADDLRKAGAKLREKSDALQHKAIGLESEKEELEEKVKNLHTQYESDRQEEEARHEIQLDQLKNGIATLLDEFSAGNLSSTGLKESLEVMGVDVQFSMEELKALPAIDVESKEEPRRLELNVDTDFKSQLRLVSECPERLAQLVAQGARRDRGLLTAGPSGKSFPLVRTPPGMPKEVSIFSARNRLPSSTQAAAVIEDKENYARQEIDVTPPITELVKTSKTSTKQGTGHRRQMSVPKMTFAKSSRQAVQNLPNREAFALTDLAVENDHSPIMRQSALPF